MAQQQQQPSVQLEPLARGPSETLVYRCTTSDGHECVLKFWQAARLWHGDNLSQPFAEMRMAQRLAQHPCFVLPLELRINAGGAELYAPFCGEHVGTWLARATAAGWDTDALAAHVGAQLMIALHELRQQGVVHRDVKLSNVLMEGWLGEVWLADFGLATTVDQQQQQAQQQQAQDQPQQAEQQQQQAQNAGAVRSAFVAGADLACVPPEYAALARGGGGSVLHDAGAAAAATSVAIDMYQAGLLLYCLLAGGGPPAVLDLRRPRRSGSSRSVSVVGGGSSQQQPAGEAAGGAAGGTASRQQAHLDRVTTFDWRGQLQRSIGCPHARALLEACLQPDPAARPTPWQALTEFEWLRGARPAAQARVEARAGAWRQRCERARLAACAVLADNLRRDVAELQQQQQAQQAQQGAQRRQVQAQDSGGGRDSSTTGGWGDAAEPGATATGDQQTGWPQLPPQQASQQQDSRGDGGWGDGADAAGAAAGGWETADPAAGSSGGGAWDAWGQQQQAQQRPPSEGRWRRQQPSAVRAALVDADRW